MRRSPQWTEFAKYPASAGTIVLAIGVTVAWWTKVDVSRLMEDPHIGRGELWRVVTSALPHVNFIHLAFNIVWLWRFGTYVEDAFGHAWTLAIFLFFAAGSGAADYAILEGGVGLSGVAYGLFGMLWVLKRRDERFADAIDANVSGLFMAWFFFCIFATVTKIMPVGNIAHGVGALLGAAIGWSVTAPTHRRERTAAIAGISLLITLALATIARPFVNLSPEAGREEAMLGFDALTRKDNSAAARWFGESVRLRPGEANTWYNLAIAQQQLKRYPESLKSYQRAHELAPQDADYRQAYQQMNEWMNSRQQGGE